MRSGRPARGSLLALLAAFPLSAATRADVDSNRCQIRIALGLLCFPTFSADLCDSRNGDAEGKWRPPENMPASRGVTAVSNETTPARVNPTTRIACASTS